MFLVFTPAQALETAEAIAEAVLTEAHAIAEEDVKTNKAIGLNALPLVPEKATFIHHCNTGALATIDYGTALGIIRTAEGGQILDADGRPAFAGPAGVRALERYCALRRFCPDDTHLYGNDEIAAALRSGSVAMATTWGGQAAAILLDSSSPARELCRTAVFPTPWNATWGVAIPVNQTEAVQQATLSVLLQAMGPDQDREVTRVAGSPVRRSSYGPTELARCTWLAAQQEMLERCRTLPVDPRLGSFLGDLYEAVHAAFAGERSPESALRRAEAAALRALEG